MFLQDEIKVSLVFFMLTTVATELLTLPLSVVSCNSSPFPYLPLPPVT